MNTIFYRASNLLDELEASLKIQEEAVTHPNSNGKRPRGTSIPLDITAYLQKVKEVELAIKDVTLEKQIEKLSLVKPTADLKEEEVIDEQLTVKFERCLQLLQKTQALLRSNKQRKQEGTT